MSGKQPGNSLKLQATTHQLLHSIFTIGKTRRYKTGISGKVINFSIYGNFDFTDDEIIDNATKIIKSQREFFNDYKFDHYLISVIENPEGNQKMALMGGIALYNSFVVHLTKNISLLQFKLLLAHEHLHNWIGNQIQNSEERLNYWWSEGFTDYYARVLSFRSGIISFNEFISEVNEILESYYKSLVIVSSNVEINQNFQSNYDFSRLPYLRGFVFALGLNCEMKSKSIKLSTDQVLKYFHKNHESVEFSNKNFIKTLKREDIYSTDLDRYFNDHIIMGQIISLDNCMPHLPLQKIDLDSHSNVQSGFYHEFPIILKVEQKRQIIDFFE